LVLFLLFVIKRAARFSPHNTEVYCNLLSFCLQRDWHTFRRCHVYEQVLENQKATLDADSVTFSLPYSLTGNASLSPFLWPFLPASPMVTAALTSDGRRHNSNISTAATSAQQQQHHNSSNMETHTTHMCLWKYFKQIKKFTLVCVCVRQLCEKVVPC